MNGALGAVTVKGPALCPLLYHTSRHTTHFEVYNSKSIFLVKIRTHKAVKALDQPDLYKKPQMQRSSYWKEKEHTSARDKEMRAPGNGWADYSGLWLELYHHG